MRSGKHLMLTLIGGLLLTLCGFSFCSAQGIVHRYTFVLSESNFTRLCSTKSMLTVNNSFPGPVIHVQKGDTVFVNVINNGKYGVTIHWHGVKQPRNPWSDGPENITQCPIPAGTNFTQQIIFSDEEGTLWWHAHSDWSRATVHGAIVIAPARGARYPFARPDAEEIIILASWFKGDVMEIINTATASGADPNVSDAFTINGQLGDLYNCSSGSTYRLLVDAGKTYLLRIINAVMNEEMFFGIANHKLTVVGMDGAYLKPVTVDYIMITPGQTMNVLFTANQAPSHYYMAGSPFVDGNVPFDNTTTTGIVQYRGYYTPPATPAFPSLPSYNNVTAANSYTALLRSLANKEHPVNVPKNVTTSLYITVSVNEIFCNGSCAGPDGNRVAASLNNISFQTPSIDILKAYYQTLPNVFTSDFPDQPPYFFNFTGDVGTNTIFPKRGTRARLINYNESVEIVFQGTNVLAAENHPMHLHGFSFYVVGVGSGNFNSTTDPRSYNLVDPPLVNTFGVPGNGWLAVRFIADNPGVWFMHCHLERHASWGMNTVLIVKNGTTRSTSMIPPPPYMPPCSGS